MARKFWKEEYRLGVDALDGDHIAICGLMERFVDALNRDRERPRIAAIFRELHDALEEHFEAEERYLSSVDFPKDELREHMDGHLDVLYTLDHEFKKWDRAPSAPGGMPNLCLWVWDELIGADMRVGRRLKVLAADANGSQH